MIGALRVLWRGLQQFERYGALFVLVNIASIALSLPIITAPAAFAGLVRFSHTAQSGHTTSFSEFWDGFRAALRQGIVVGLLNIAVIGVLLINFISYSNQSAPIFFALRAAWLIILFIWLGTQLYLWPLLIEMETPTLIGGFRNAALMVRLNPVFTLILLLTLALVIAISTRLLAPWVLITNGLIASIATAAVRDRLALARGQMVDQPDREDLRSEEL